MTVKMAIRYFWDIDSVGAPNNNKEKDLVDVMQKEFGAGDNFIIVGNEEIHQIELLRDVAKFQHSDSRQSSHEMLELRIVNFDWHKDDKLVLISGDEDFRELLENMRKIGVQTIVVNHEGPLNPTMPQETSEIHSLDEFFQLKSNYDGQLYRLLPNADR